MEVQTSLGRVKVIGDYQRQNGVYVSPDYEGAENRVALRVKGRVGAITIQQVG